MIGVYTYMFILIHLYSNLFSIVHKAMPELISGVVQACSIEKVPIGEIAWIINLKSCCKKVPRLSDKVTTLSDAWSSLHKVLCWFPAVPQSHEDGYTFFSLSSSACHQTSLESIWIHLKGSTMSQVYKFCPSTFCFTGNCLLRTYVKCGTQNVSLQFLKESQYFCKLFIGFHIYSLAP